MRRNPHQGWWEQRHHSGIPRKRSGKRQKIARRESPHHRHVVVRPLPSQPRVFGGVRGQLVAGAVGFCLLCHCFHPEYFDCIQRAAVMQEALPFSMGPHVVQETSGPMGIGLSSLAASASWVVDDFRCARLWRFAIGIVPLFKLTV